MYHQQTEPSILNTFARLLGTELHEGRLKIPAEFGEGYCTGFVFNKFIRMMIFDYKLHNDVFVVNPEEEDTDRTILFKFTNVFHKTAIPANTPPKAIPSVLITTKNLHAGSIIPIHSNNATINIEVDANYLSGLFDASVKSPVLQSLLQNTQPLLFEQAVYPSLQKVVDEILSESVSETFKSFFLRVKAEELICCLLMELEKRNETKLYDLNTRDIQTLYQVKERILQHLETPPVIKDLAAFACMSPTKLKRLFKQIFGNSVFNYYQGFRMKEAALLLKDKKLSVSDVGYKLGFTNLSHFSKTFKEHVGMKPKQYNRYQSQEI